VRQCSSLRFQLTTLLSQFLPTRHQNSKFLGIVLGNYIAHNLDKNQFKQGLANDAPANAFFTIMAQEAQAAQAAMEKLHDLGLGRFDSAMPCLAHTKGAPKCCNLLGFTPSSFFSFSPSTAQP